MLFALSRPLHDFIEYWTAAHLLIEHKNPYSLAEVSHMERSLGFEQSVPLMLLSPPMTLTLLAPLGLARSYVLAWLVWVAVLTAAVGFASRMLMDVYFGELRLPEISDTSFYRGLFAFTFYPVLLCLRFTQTAPFMLLGLAGFLFFESRKRSVIAGAFLSLTLIKPHLVFLIWLAVLLWSCQQRRWKTLTSAIGFTALLTAIALVIDRQAIQQYLELVRSPYLQAYAAGVAALVRKMTDGVGTLWIQLVPPGLGLVWFLMYWRRHRKTWSWTEHLPMLVVVSVLTSAYGWLFDQTLLALPVIAVAGKRANALGRLSGNPVVWYTALNCILMLVMALPTLNLLPAPIFLAVWLRRQSNKAQAATALVGAS